METWATQEEIGRRLGVDTQAAGELLVTAGLKVGREASPDALARGLAAPDVSPLGRPFLRWQAAEVLPLLEPLVRRLEAAPTVPATGRSRTSARGRPAAGRPPATRSTAPAPVVGTTFDAVIAVHAVADPDPGPTGWAYTDQHTRITTTGATPHATQRRGELLAVLHLLDHSPSEAHLLIRTDSEHLVRTATVWGPTWQRNGWRQRDGQRPENLDLVEPLLTTIAKRAGRARFGLADTGDPFVVLATRSALEAAHQLGS
ncbi:RNase H family protein [Georgenia muralis]